MAIEVSCGCGFRTSVQDSAAGKRGRCPACGAVISVPAAQRVAVSAKGGTTPLVQRSATFTEEAVAAEPVRARPHVVQSVCVQTLQSNSAAKAGLIVSLVGLPICWVPFLGPALGILAIVLSVVGLCVALGRGGRGGGYAVAGGAIGSVVLFVGGLLTYGTIAAARYGGQVASGRPQLHAGTTVARHDGGTTTSPAASASHVANRDQGWAAFGAAATLDSIHVRIIEARHGRAQLETYGGIPYESDEAFLILKVEILSSAPNEKREYRSWRGVSGVSSDDATLIDNFRNEYAPHHYDATSLPGAVGFASLYPGTPITDILVFERPIETAQELFLELDGRNVGATGTFRFRVPSSAVTRTPPGQST